MPDTGVLVDSRTTFSTTTKNSSIDEFPAGKKLKCEKRDESFVAAKIYAANVLSIDNHIN